MSQRDRAKLFDTLAELRRHYPDWRLGQLIANVSGWADQDIWVIEDEQLLAVAKEHLRAVATKSSEMNAPGIKL